MSPLSDTSLDMLLGDTLCCILIFADTVLVWPGRKIGIVRVETRITKQLGFPIISTFYVLSSYKHYFIIIIICFF